MVVQVTALPCLRCGSRVTVDVMEHPDSGKMCGVRLKCLNDHAWDEWCDSLDEAINAWNERPPVKTKRVSGEVGESQQTVNLPPRAE